MHMKLRGKVALALGLLAATFSGSASALEIDKHFPEQTEQVVVFNFRQLLSSRLITKRIGLETLRGAIKSQEELTKVLDSLGLDLLKDVDRILIAGPAGGKQDEGIIVIKGNFKVDKFTAAAKKAAKDNADAVSAKTVKGANGKQHEIYEVKVDQLQMPLFVGIYDKNTILAAAAKDYLIDGLSVQANRKPKLKDKEFQELVQKMSDKQALGFAMVGKGLASGAKEAGVDIPEQINDVLKGIQAISGGLTVDDGFNLELSIASKDAKGAKTLRQTVDQYLNLGKAFLGIAAMQQMELQPLVGFANSLKTSSKDKVVTIKGGFTSDDLDKLVPRDQ